MNPRIDKLPEDQPVVCLPTATQPKATFFKSMAELAEIGKKCYNPASQESTERNRKSEIAQRFFEAKRAYQLAKIPYEMQFGTVEKI